MAKYLDYSGVQTLWNKIKTRAINKVDQNKATFPGLFVPNSDENTVGDNNILLAYNVYNLTDDGKYVDSGHIAEVPINSATSTSAGLMSKTDKIKLNSITQTDINNIKAISAKIASGYNLVCIQG